MVIRFQDEKARRGLTHLRGLRLSWLQFGNEAPEAVGVFFDADSCGGFDGFDL